MTEDQEALLLDKREVWKRQAMQGPSDFRDYNARAVDALDALFRRKHELEGEVSTLRLQQQTDRQTIASLSATPEGLREAVSRVADQVCKPFARPDDESDIFNDGVRAMRDALLLHSAGWSGGLLNGVASPAALQPQAQPAAISPETER